MVGTNTESSKLAVTLGTCGHDDHRSMVISHGKLESAATIVFERTLRVPDNKDINNLPPSLAQFPLFSVAEYQDRMPEDMASKGGVFLPMYQREAMWIRFSSKEPFALKVYVGGVNAISGVPIDEKPEAMLKRLRLSNKVKQDYLVLPEQPWLDGIASEDGNIRQFVAMPKGSGYSVEAQVTGKEKIGGLQFELTPVKRTCPASMNVFLFKGTPQQKTVVLKLHEKGLNDMSTMLDLKKVIEKEYDIKVASQFLSLESSKYASTHSNIGSDQSTFSETWISEDHEIGVHHLLAERENSRHRSRGIVDFDMVKSKAYVGYSGGFGGAPPAPAMALACSAPAPAGLMQQMSTKSASPSMSLNSQKSTSSSGQSHRSRMVATTLPLRGTVKRRAADPQPHMQTNSEPPAAPTPKVEAMGLAAGGLIKQSINEDKYPASIWDTDNSILFNVQLLNSESFVAVTGCAPPSTPIDAKTYKQHGWPFYDIWMEEKTGIKGDFDAVKSVGEMDESLAMSGKNAFWGKLSGNGKTGSEFKRDESLKFPVVMLDMDRKRTFKPFRKMEEEAEKLKAEGSV